MPLSPSAPATLVILAAGLGSRYGGLKQLDAVGPTGATLMDYAVFDAARAGFTDAVFIIRPEMEEGFAPLAARYGAKLAVRTVLQRIEPGRRKPWGTAEAVLAAADAVGGPFVVVNADDFYGAPAYHAALEFLRTGDGWAVVGYRLEDTLSDAGGVNRAVCRTENGRLTALEEIRDIDRERARALGTDMLVSMNMWAFTPDIFPLLCRGFAEFKKTAGPDEEYLLPDAVQSAIASGAATVRVLDPGSRWFGMTHAADRARVARELAALTRGGVYPDPLL